MQDCTADASLLPTKQVAVPASGWSGILKKVRFVMRVVIVEDSEIDRLNLKTLLEEHSDVEIVGEGGSGHN